MHSEATRGTRETAPHDGAPAPRRRSRRAVALTWLRKVHLYVGLWGALLGMVFGATGILLNHCAIMKIPFEKTVQRSSQLPLPGPAPATPAGLSAWLQQELQFAPVAPPIVKTQPTGKSFGQGASCGSPSAGRSALIGRRGPSTRSILWATGS